MLAESCTSAYVYVDTSGGIVHAYSRTRTRTSWQYPMVAGGIVYIIYTHTHIHTYIYIQVRTLVCIPSSEEVFRVIILCKCIVGPQTGVRSVVHNHIEDLGRVAGSSSKVLISFINHNQA